MDQEDRSVLREQNQGTLSDSIGMNENEEAELNREKDKK